MKDKIPMYKAEIDDNFGIERIYFTDKPLYKAVPFYIEKVDEEKDFKELYFEMMHQYLSDDLKKKWDKLDENISKFDKKYKNK